MILNKLTLIVGLVFGSLTPTFAQSSTWTVDVRNFTPLVQKVGVSYVFGQWNQPYQRIQYTGTTNSDNFEVLKEIPEQAPLVLWVRDTTNLVQAGTTRLYIFGETNVLETFPAGNWMVDVWNYMKTDVYVLVGANDPILLQPGLYRNYYGSTNQSLVFSNSLVTQTFLGPDLSTNALAPNKIYLMDLDGEIIVNTGTAYP